MGEKMELHVDGVTGKQPFHAVVPMLGGCYEFPKMTYRVLPDHRILIHIPFYPSFQNQTRIEIKNMDYK